MSPLARAAGPRQPRHTSTTVLSRPGFRRYFLGYTTSLLGTAMSATATAFALLDTGAGADGLGLVMAAGIVSIVLCLPLAGVAADRLGSRRVLLASDAVRCLAQAAFAVELLAVARPPLWAFALIAVVRGTGEGFFAPALSALIPRLVDRDILTPANALMGMARSAASVAGPALSGVLVAAFGPAVVLGVDAASYGVSVAALLTVRVAAPGPRKRQSMLRDLREGWTQFRARPWLWLSTVQFALFNFLVWAPFLVLGPTLAHSHYGGARAWGMVMGCYGLGAVVGGAALLRREPRHPLTVAIIATAAYALPPAAFALELPLAAVCSVLLCAGAGTAVAGALSASVEQRVLPADMLARISSYNYLGAFALGPLGLAAAGPAAATFGVSRVLGFGALWQIAATVVILSLPGGRRLTDADQPTRDPESTTAQDHQTGAQTAPAYPNSA
jgi:MFS family permease